jgi:thiamine phosphate synthase YjbQ (UPF0047 family)
MRTDDCGCSTLSRRSKGCHLVTEEVNKAIKDGLKGTKIGILHLFIKHTSAALTINENYDSGNLSVVSRSSQLR